MDENTLAIIITIVILFLFYLWIKKYSHVTTSPSKIQKYAPIADTDLDDRYLTMSTDLHDDMDMQQTGYRFHEPDGMDILDNGRYGVFKPSAYLDKPVNKLEELYKK